MSPRSQPGRVAHCVHCGCELPGMHEQSVVSHFPCPDCGRRLSRFDVRWKRPSPAWIPTTPIALLAVHFRGLLWLTVRGIGVFVFWIILILMLEAFAADLYESPDLPHGTFWYVFVPAGAAAGWMLMYRLSDQAGGESVFLVVAAILMLCAVLILGHAAAAGMSTVEYIDILPATVPGAISGAVAVWLVAGGRLPWLSSVAWW